MTKLLKSYFTFVITGVLLIMTSFAAFAASPDAKSANIYVDVELDDNQVRNFEFVEVENGVYEATIPITSKTENNSATPELRAASAFAAEVKIKLNARDSISNWYDVTAVIIANSYFNGTKGTFTATSTSILNPKTYATYSINRNFPATTINYLSVGALVIPPGEQSVRLKVTGAQIYSLTYGWVSGFTFNTIFRP